ncbi:reverse transcriptase domain-containing protein, partial [Tanacetum coccineum]
MLRHVKTSPLETVKAISESCVTYGGRHPYYEFLTTDGNTFNASAAAATYNHNQGYRPQGDPDYRASNQMGPPGFPPVQNNQNRFNQNQVNDEAITFKVSQTSRYSYNDAESVNRIDVINVSCEEYAQEVLRFSDSSTSGNPTPSLDPILSTSFPSLTPFEGIIKLLDARLIFPISDSPWVSPVHCVPKKGAMTVVENEDNELIPTRLVTGWCVCIDYQNINDAIRKDHFTLPFMDQMLERLAGNEYYCFLDGFSGYFQIPIDPQDQEKTTFTCPYGTFAYRRMPFGLCNAPGTFQRCMMAIFHDMIEETMEVFMDDFSVFGDSFSSCLSHLDKMLKRIEVDKAKVDVIAKLPHPTSVKGIR